jgi:hypothetical protein
VIARDIPTIRRALGLVVYLPTESFDKAKVGCIRNRIVIIQIKIITYIVIVVIRDGI